MRNLYQTKQKEKILQIIEKETDEFTIMNLYDKLNHSIGLTTIYRFIDKLVLEGKVQKIPGKGNTVYYQYLVECKEENHFFLKCSNCGQLLHIDCDCMKELSDHIEKKHKFQLEKNHIVINGLCKNCIHEKENIK